MLPLTALMVRRSACTSSMRTLPVTVPSCAVRPLRPRTVTFPLTVDAVTTSAAAPSLNSMSPETRFKTSPLTFVARMLPDTVRSVTLASCGTVIV